MKTIYTTHLFEPFKKGIDDELDEKIVLARDEVFRSATHNLWRPRIEIDLPSQIPDSYQCGNFLIKVEWDDGTEDNAHQRLSRILGGKEARGFVKVDLGHYCYEGWDSAIEDEDLSELEGVFIGHQFVDGFTEPHKRHTNKKWGEIQVDEQHIKKLVSLVYGEALNNIKDYRDHKFFRQYLWDWVDIGNLSKNILQGKESFNELIKLCEGLAPARASEDEDFERVGALERF